MRKTMTVQEPGRFLPERMWCASVPARTRKGITSSVQSSRPAFAIAGVHTCSFAACLLQVTQGGSSLVQGWGEIFQPNAAARMRLGELELTPSGSSVGKKEKNLGQDEVVLDLIQERSSRRSATAGKPKLEQRLAGQAQAQTQQVDTLTKLKDDSDAMIRTVRT